MSTTKNYRLAVMVSGYGTILEAMITKKLPIEIVLSDRPCRGLDLAKDNNITPVLVDRSAFGWDPKQPELFNREAFSSQIAAKLNQYRINLVAMAGFMTILDNVFFDQYQGVILNTHPSLLPSFPGAHAARDAINYGVKVSGCTVHIATPHVDQGQILGQETVKVLSSDTETSLQERIKTKERLLYPKIIKQILSSSLHLS